MSKKVITVDSEEAFKEFSAYMKEEKLFELKVPMETPDGRVFELLFVYEPATAYQIAKIYEDSSRDMSTDENFDYMCDLFNSSIRNWKFSNVPRGKADYERGEISIRDLTTDVREILQRAVAPGIGKTDERIERELTVNRRKIGKGMRRISDKLVEPTT